MQGKSWTAERIDLLRRLWADGETAAAIAVRVGGMSRSAVLGKIFRLRLAGPGSGEIAQKERSAAEPTQNAGDVHVACRRRSPKRAHQPQPSLNAAKRGRTLLELTNNTCRFEI
jgi:GcrA cell cycle regulator